jgi:hypothetical protein
VRQATPLFIECHRAKDDPVVPPHRPCQKRKGKSEYTRREREEEVSTGEERRREREEEVSMGEERIGHEGIIGDRAHGG